MLEMIVFTASMRGFFRLALSDGRFHPRVVMDRRRVRGIKSSIYLSFSRLPNLMRLALRLCAANISRREEISWNASKDYWLVGRYSALLATISWGCTYYDRDYRYGRYDRTTARKHDRWERARDRDRDWRRDRFARYDDRWYGSRYDRDDWRDRHSRIDRHYYE